ncbi:hypothetical protein HHK36_015615 [Tetracentron sinense]|uniref:Kinetochore protein SPC25 n=1 Tax=Tetracentron sinense TaxID=13715 RepID=A0A834Z199_TETSI|nr:hypothetical protein HHK36_015615 [Tetracentron sinense]
MQSKMEESIRSKMEELRLLSDREISIQHQKVSSAMTSFRKSMQSVTLVAEETSKNQVQLGKLKAHLREVEDDLVKALAVKNRKEAKRMATIDSISATKARVEELKRRVQDQRDRKDEYATIISQQSHALTTLEEKSNQETKHKEDLEDAILWYNRVLGFRIEGGHGVKFIFTNINLKNPNEEYSFTIRHANDIYTLLDCDPYLDDTKELINELNQTNGLFKFVRVMRGKFQAAATAGFLPQPTSLRPDSSANSISAPVSSISTDSKSESLSKQNELQDQYEEIDRPPKKFNHGRAGKPAIVSPGSASSLRRSPRFKVKK